jgi:hypothetical protein
MSAAIANNKFVCIDVSGSTAGSRKYKETVQNIVRKENDATTFLLWDTECKQTTKNGVLKYPFTSGGGTNPQVFAPLIPEGSDLTIITDGQVGSTEVENTDKILKERKFGKVFIKFINTGGSINLSVSAPFTRNCQTFTIEDDDGSHIANSQSGSIDLKQYYDKPDAFLNASEDLLKQIIIQNVGRKNIKLHHELVDLKTNLLATIAQASAAGIDFSAVRTILVNQKNYMAAISKLDQIITSIDSTKPQKIEAIIQTMIQKSSGNYDFSLNQLQSGRLIRAVSIKDVNPVTDAEAPTIEECKFECPILMDNDIPVLLIANDGKPAVLDGLEKSQMDDIITNPFKIFQNPILVERIKTKLDSIIGLSAYIGLTDQQSPYTRQPIVGVMAFGNHSTHYAATKYAMSQILFPDSKLVGVSALWSCVIWLVCKHYASHISTNKEFMSIMKDWLRHTLQTGPATNITLSGLPVSPVIKAPADIALWYSMTVSPFISEKKQVDEPAINRLRSFGNSAEWALKIIDSVLKYPYPKDMVDKLYTLYSATAWLMALAKHHNPEIRNYWRRIIRAQYQNSVILDPDQLQNDYSNIIMIDGPATNPPKLPTKYSGIQLHEWVAIAELIDPQKKLGDIYVDLHVGNDTVVPQPVRNYGYPEDGSYLECKTMSIDPNIMRPFKMVGNHSWYDLAEKHNKCSINDQLSCYNYFVKYVHEFNAFPTKTQFIKFLDIKVNNSESKRRDTLPKHIIEFVDEVFYLYNNVDAFDLTPQEFLWRALPARDRC